MITSTIRLPAEWEAQDGVLLAWPHHNTDWRPFLAKISEVFVQLVHHITRYETCLIVSPESDMVKSRLEEARIDLSRVSLYTAPTDDTWARDFGPLTILRDGRPHLLDFGFNGWGNKFAANNDNQITGHLHAGGAFGATQRTVIDLILEGGSLESDGHGTLLTTTKCLLNPNRNPQLDKGQIETALEKYLGARKVHWLDHGYLAGDDTDGHIDTLARLCPNDCILYVRCEDTEDEHFTPLQRMEIQLRQMRNFMGEPYRLIPLPWPQACYDDEGQRLPATYANYLVINGAVLVPTYADPADEAALAAVGKAYPEREIIEVDCRPVIRQHGSLHCLTMQIPRGVLP